MYYAAAALLALLAATWLVVATRDWGLGVSPDSATYLVTSEHISKGFGLVPQDDPERLASPHYPPLYPIVLAGLRWISHDVREAARWLHVLLLAVNVALVALLTSRAVGRVAGVVAAAFLAVNGAVLEQHAWLLSESLALTFMLAAMILLVDALRDGSPPGRRRKLVVWAALATAGACVTRYASISLLAAGVFAILLAPTARWRLRLIDAAAFAVLAAAPLALWVVRNHLVAHTTVNREIAWLGLRPHLVDQFRETLVRWAPLPDRLAVTLVALALAAAGVIVAWRRALRATPSPPARSPVANRVVLLFAFCYGGLVAATVLFLDRSTPLDARILLPLQVAIAILVVTWVAKLSARLRHGPAIAIGAALFLIATAAHQSIVLGRDLARTGHGFSARWWTESATLKYAGTLPASTVLYSNAPEVLYIHFGRDAKLLPRPYDANLAQRLRGEDATVVWFTRYKRSGNLNPERDLVGKLGLIRTARLSDGAVYRAAPAHPTTSASATAPGVAAP
jgi:4-amino-4-deoxy-L-arabinose transferase-like glycosyltransferase